MSRTNHICLMATYNEWMSAKVYEAARGLSDEVLSADRKAFFWLYSRDSEPLSGRRYNLAEAIRQAPNEPLGTGAGEAAS